MYIALFFDEEGEATTTFGNIESSYTCNKNNLADVPEKKNLAWTYYDSTNKTWTLVNTPFYKALAEDAGIYMMKKMNCGYYERLTVGLIYNTWIYFRCQTGRT